MKEIINRAGEKISPREVDDVLLSHPDVRQAVTFAMPHPTIGEDVVAAVVVANGSSVTGQMLRTFTLEALSAAKVPSQIILLPEIPKGATGKIQRIGLHEKLKEWFQADFVAPVSETGLLLAGLWQELLGVERIGLHDNFFGLGGDSLRGMRLATRIREAVGIEFEVADLFRSPTIEHLARIIDAKVEAHQTALLDYVDSLSAEEVSRLLAGKRQ